MLIISILSLLLENRNSTPTTGNISFFRESLEFSYLLQNFPIICSTKWPSSAFVFCLPNSGHVIILQRIVYYYYYYYYFLIYTWIFPLELKQINKTCKLKSSFLIKTSRQVFSEHESLVIIFLHKSWMYCQIFNATSLQISRQIFIDGHTVLTQNFSFSFNFFNK